MVTIEFGGEIVKIKDLEFITYDESIKKILESVRPKGGFSPSVPYPDLELANIAEKELSAKILYYDELAKETGDPKVY